MFPGRIGLVAGVIAKLMLEVFSDHSDTNDHARQIMGFREPSV